MGKRQFTDAERYAVYTVHGEKCYLCNEPVDLFTMEVDHIIPEFLADHPDRLAEIIGQFGLPLDFDLQSFANWLPACGTCNTRKRDLVFNPTPRIQVEIQRAQARAQRATELAQTVVTTKAIARALNTIRRAAETGALPETIRNELQEFAHFHTPRREPEVASEPMKLAPLIQVISQDDRLTIVRGPYGVGGGPSDPNAHSSFRCGSCGSTAWNGARCVVCGELSDD